MDSSGAPSSSASRGVTDALIAKPPRTSPVHAHAQRGYGLLHQSSPPAPVTAASAAPVPPLGLGGIVVATPAASSGVDYTQFHSPLGSISMADATPGGDSLLATPPGVYGTPNDSMATRSARAASLLLHIDDDAESEMTKERPLCASCSACHSCACDRCLSHCWWLSICCGFILLSSLPRLLTLADFIITALIYSLSFSGRSQPSLSFWQFLERDWTHYDIRTSGGSLVVLAFLRMCILFFVFAYRFHLRRRAFIAATSVAVASVLFVLVKFSINTNSHLHPLLLWSLVITGLEYICWLALRRQRVRRPQLAVPPEVLAAEAEAAEAEAAALAAEEAAHSQDQALRNPVASLGDDDVETGSSGDSYARSTLLGSVGGDDTPVLGRSLGAESSLGSGRSGLRSGSLFGGVATGGALSGKQSSSYQRLGGEEPEAQAGPRSTPMASFHAEPSPRSSPRRAIAASSGNGGGMMIRPSSLGGSGGMPGLGTSAASSPFLGSTPRSLSMSIPRLSLSMSGVGLSGPLGMTGSFSGGGGSGLAADRELDATALADADSLFMQIDSLLVHYKLSIHGRAIVGRDPEAQARAAVARGLAQPQSRGDDSVAPSGDATGAGTGSGTGGGAGSSTDATPFPHPVVLLHGFGSSLFQWRAAWGELAQRCAVVVAFDRPGFGLTSRPLRDANGSFGTFVAREGGGAEAGGTGAGGVAGAGSGRSGAATLREQSNPYTQDYSVSLLQRLLARLGLADHPAVLVGHSTGGTIALRAALSAPVRCRGLFLVAPNVLTQGFPDLVKSLLKTKLGALITQQLVRSELGEVAWKRAWYDPKRIPAESLAHYQRTLLLRNQVEALQEVAACASRAQDAARDPLANLVLHLHRLAPEEADEPDDEREKERERERGRGRGLSTSVARGRSNSGSSVNSPPGSRADSIVAQGSSSGSGASRSGVPVCLVHGLQDKLLSVSESVRVYKQMKSEGVAVTLIKIDHCASVPHEEYPQLFNDHLAAFLHEIEQRAAGGAHEEAGSDDEDDDDTAATR